MSEPKKKAEAGGLRGPGTAPRLWFGAGLILAVLVLVEEFIPVASGFTASEFVGFGAWFGFGTGCAMVVLARLLGWLVTRSESYYHSGRRGPAADREEENHV